VLSYRHSFHAGNLADVLKHAVVHAVLDAALTKPAPLLCLDTHAGAGVYRLDNHVDAEHHAGVGAVRAACARAKPPPIIERYLALVDSHQHLGASWYPGSASIAAGLLRDADRLIFAERHPADADALAALFRADSRVLIQSGDGYALLKSVLPPRKRRGVILIDPAYELADEPDQLVDGLRNALARFRHGVYIVWYPLHGKHDPARLKRRYARLDPPKTLCIELDPRQPAPRGATGSGLLIVNPPFQALSDLEALTDYLGRTQAAGGRTTYEWLVPE
jgi:23S rRNA (adenine2030-N6)-methyltransferase